VAFAPPNAPDCTGHFESRAPDRLAAIDANKPTALVAQAAIGGGANGARQGNATPATLPSTLGNQTASPSFALPGAKSADSIKPADSGKVTESGRKPGVAGSSNYTVKRGDALWRIAARTYGNKNADRMLNEIKAANPGLDADRLKEGQRIVLPKDSTGN